MVRVKFPNYSIWGGDFSHYLLKFALNPEESDNPGELRNYFPVEGSTLTSTLAEIRYNSPG